MDKNSKGSDGQYLKLASGVPTWTTHTTPTTTITVQEDATTAYVNVDSQGNANLCQITLPNRSGGYFIACANVMGEGNIHSYFKIGSTAQSVMGSENTSHHQHWSQFCTGPLDGSVLTLYGYSSGNGHFDGSTATGHFGYCTMHVFEVSQTS